MTTNLRATVALVTGGNRGLGRAYVDALLTRGATVYLGSRDVDESQPTEREQLRTIRLDITNPDDIARLPALVPDLTMLINNAGVHETTDVGSPDAASVLARVLSVNVVGMVAVTSALHSILTNNGGVVINILSAGSWLSGPDNLAYSASKAAGLSVTSSMRSTLNPSGVQVVAVHAGFIDTDMMADFPGPKLSPVDVANTTLDAIADGDQEVLIDHMSRGAKEHSIDPVPPFSPIA